MRTIATTAILKLLITAALPVVAQEDDDKLFIRGTAWVYTHVDDFTDAYQATSLRIGAVGTIGANGKGAMVFMHRGSGNPRIAFWRHKYDTPPPDDEVIAWILVRMDRDEAQSYPVFWTEDGNVVLMEIYNEAFFEQMLDDFAAASRLIYRVEGSEITLTILVPDEIDELVAEFRRRVMAQEELGDG